MDQVVIVKPSAVFLLIRLVMTLFMVETLYGLCFVAYLFLSNIYSIEQTFIYFIWILQIIKFIATMYILSDIGVRYLNSRYYIADYHMLSEKGLMNNQEKVYELNSLRKVMLEQDWLGRKLGYGNVKLILGARGYAEELVLRAIATPRRIKEALDARLGVVY